MPVETIVRLAARGDGVTESGRFFPLAAPGDRVSEAGEIMPGPHHQAPPCRHFPECGGCQLQHVDDAAFAAFLGDRIVSALASQGLAAPVLLPAHLSPPNSRRRTALSAARRRLFGGERCAGSSSGAARPWEARAETIRSSRNWT